MKPFLFSACLLLLACEDHSSGDTNFPAPLVNRPSVGGNLPSHIAGTYVLEEATLNGPKFEVVVGSNSLDVVVYSLHSDITHLVRQIVFRGSSNVSFSHSCSESEQAIVFKPNGKTSHACQGDILNAFDMGFWSTTGAENNLLAWSILHDNSVIECEIVPYEVNNGLLVGYLVFPLPTNTVGPLLEGENHQYRKIKITLRRV